MDHFQGGTSVDSTPLDTSKIIPQRIEQEPPANDLLILGKNYYRGEGVKKDIKKALNYFTLAGKKGNVEAQYWAGLTYDSGLVEDENHTQAIKWYTRAAEGGNVEAMKWLGFIYKYQGKYKLAEKYLKAAAEFGDENAAMTLAPLYVDDKYDIPQDIDEYAKWLEVATGEGNSANDLAKYELAVLYDTGQPDYLKAFTDFNLPPPAFQTDKRKAIELYKQIVDSVTIPMGGLIPSAAERINVLQAELGIDDGTFYQEPSYKDLFGMGGCKVDEQHMQELEEIRERMKKDRYELNHPNNPSAPPVKKKSSSDIESNPEDHSRADVEEQVLPSLQSQALSDLNLYQLSGEGETESGSKSDKRIKRLEDTGSLDATETVTLAGFFQAENDVSDQLALNRFITALNDGTPSADKVIYLLPYVIEAYSRGSADKKNMVEECLALILEKYEATEQQSGQIESIMKNN